MILKLKHLAMFDEALDVCGGWCFGME